MTIYLLPGQGSDRRIFKYLRFDGKHAIKYIEYETPGKGVTLKQFSGAVAGEIDTNEKFILIGVSMGGMICSELAEILHPETVIIISSAKNRGELPWRYKIQKFIPLYKFIPAKFLLRGAMFLQPVFEPDRNKYKSIFTSMLGSKKPIYIKRTIDMIINWERTTNRRKIIHIHGDRDHTLPIKNISPDFVIKDGSHMMTLTRVKEISVVLNNLIKECG